MSYGRLDPSIYLFHTLDCRCSMGDLIPASICYNLRFIQYRNCVYAIGKGLTLATVILIT